MSMADTQRIVALANVRKYPIEKLLTFELTEQNKLFDKDGLFIKAEKSELIRELENIEGYNKNGTINNEIDCCLIIDVMLLIRKINWKGNSTFENLADKFVDSVLQKANVQQTKRIDFIFDSYFNYSLKSTEHERRRTHESIELHTIDNSTKLLKQEDKFWGSSANKILLQQFLREEIFKKSIFEKYSIVFSTLNNDPSTSNDLNLISPQLQREDIEEADIKIFIHMNDAVQRGFKNIYLICSDTDVIVLALYFFNRFKEDGLQVKIISFILYVDIYVI